MTRSTERYLAAKRTVDDRALNRRVLDRFAAAVEEYSEVDEYDSADDPFSVVEVGAGIGTMPVRLLELELLPSNTSYELIDVDADALAAARRRLPGWLDNCGYEAVRGAGGATTDDPTAAEPMVFQRGDRRVVVETTVAEATEYLRHADPDLLVGAAFLDLLTSDDRDRLFDHLDPGTCCYFPITFDGGTIFEPTVDESFDPTVIERYHHDMRTRDQPGDPVAGRRLLERMASEGQVLATGGSDWTVYPDGDGYPADEAYFLRYIVDTVAGALADDPEIDADRLDEWTRARHEQIDTGELVYIAHQLDVLCTV